MLMSFNLENENFLEKISRRVLASQKVQNKAIINNFISFNILPIDYEIA